ncbi:sigma-70 family RNA polymerase sigma factor [bacterium]|nr:sigma-70 family RNA polymerase sigma factor [bacterium]
MLENELEIIAKAKNGDSIAFKRLFDNYSPVVYRVSLQIVGNVEEAKDVTQEVFIRVFRFFHTFDEEKSFFTWLYKIVLNASYDQAKKQRRNTKTSLDERQEEEYPDFPSDSSEAPDKPLLKEELRSVVMKLVDTLTNQQKTVFVLHDLQGISHEEVANILKCSQGNVRSHLFAARKAIRESLEKNYPELLESI